MSRNSRKLRNILINPRFQLKFSFHFIVTGLVIFGVVIVLINERLMRVSDIMASGELMDFEHSVEFNDLMFQILSFSLFGFVAFIIFSFTFALIISHRIAGPVVAICAFIEELKKGNYGFRRELRPNDELVPIVEQLSELAHILQQRNKEQEQEREKEKEKEQHV